MKYYLGVKMNQLYVHIKYGYILHIVLNEKKEDWEDEIKKYILIEVKNIKTKHI